MTLEPFPVNRSTPLAILAFDFGTNRIGVAFGQSLTGTASTVCVLKAKDGVPDWNQILKLIQVWNTNPVLVSTNAYRQWKRGNSFSPPTLTQKKELP
jgi:putative Holliday junction resolvase